MRVPLRRLVLEWGLPSNEGNAGREWERITLVGSLGNDTLSGGIGNDSFVFNSPNEGVDTITDFSVKDDTLLR